MAVMFDMTDTKKAAAVVSEVINMERIACCRVDLTRSSRHGFVPDKTRRCWFWDQTLTRMNVSSAPTPEKYHIL